MRWMLFLDDERYPKDYDEDWVIARNFDDAMWYLESKGIPNHIAFDHDLGMKSKTGYQFAKAFCDYLETEGFALPEDFSYSVHSMNPVGAKNIRDYMESYLEFCAKCREEV